MGLEHCVVGCCSGRNALVVVVEEGEAKICDDNLVDMVGDGVDTLLHDDEIVHDDDKVGCDHSDGYHSQGNEEREEASDVGCYSPKQQLAAAIPGPFSSFQDVGSPVSMEMEALLRRGSRKRPALLRRGRRKRPATQLGRGPRETVQEGWAW